MVQTWYVRRRYVRAQIRMLTFGMALIAVSNYIYLYYLVFITFKFIKFT